MVESCVVVVVVCERTTERDVGQHSYTKV